MKLKGKKWAVVYSKTFYDEALLIETNFYAAMGKLGITVEEPAWLEVKAKASSHDYVNEILRSVTP
jgi:hypothetical protein